MMRTALIHIGVEKTGTTTIQHNLYENRHILKKNGIAILESTGGINNIKIASWCYHLQRVDGHIIRFGITNTEERIKWRKNFRNELADRLNSLPADIRKVIISGEHFHSRLITPEEVQTLKELLAPYFQKFVILVYLRRQDQLAMSAFSTSCKSGYLPNPLFQPGIKADAPYYNYHQLLQRWAAVFGKENIAVKIFEKDRLFNQDVLLDFYEFAEIKHKSWGLKNYGSHNARLSGPAALVSSRFLKYFPGYTREAYNQENEKTNKALIAAFESKYEGVKLRPSKASAISFYNIFKPSNDRVAKEWFGTETLFDEDFSAYPDEQDDFNFDTEDIDTIFRIIPHQTHRPMVFNKTNIEDFLSKYANKSVAYCPNPGNAGDAIIAHATYQVFEKLNIRPEMISYNEVVEDKIIFFGGGGNLVEGKYDHAYRFIKNNYEKNREIILLPHTVYGYDELLLAAKNLTIICREKVSYENLAKTGFPVDRLFLAPDMAFLLSKKDFQQFIMKGDGTANCFRDDQESAIGQFLPYDNMDISLSWNGDLWKRPVFAENVTRNMACYLSAFETVKTDRLHVAVLAAILGKKVELYSNNYYKIKAVYDYSLKQNFENVKFIDIAGNQNSLKKSDYILELQKKIHILEAELVAKNQQLDDLSTIKQQLNDVFASKSWKLTKPLRDLTRKLK